MCFSPYLGIGCGGGGGGSPQGLVHNLLMQSFTLGSSKIKVFETYFFDTVTTKIDHPRNVKHVLGSIYVFFTLFGYSLRERGGGGGSLKGLVHNLLMQSFTLGNSKVEVFETYFFDIVTTQNDHPRYVKHVLGSIYVFFTLFGYTLPGGGGGALPRYTTCLCKVSPWAAQKLKFPKLIFLIF